MVWTQGFPILAIIFQCIFIILFGVFVKYPHEDDVEPPENATDGSAAGHLDPTKDDPDVAKYYPSFQDIHVMMFIGFGFLMTFLKRYGYSSIGLNMFIAAFVIQWGTLTGGWILHFKNNAIYVHMTDLIGAEFAAATVLISFGALLGKINALQLLIMAIFEVVLFQANEYIVFKLCQASDVGDSMVVHAFGAYFGLTIARILRSTGVKKAEEKEASVYHSDLFAMIGTIFLWLFWPSFNSATAVGQGQYRAVINTYYSLAASVVISFAVSSLVEKNKFNMVHVQNATLAGGVAIGTMADMIIEPWAALLVGTLAGILSVIGYRYVTPFLTNRLGIHDTCGVHNLHGMPAIMSGIGGIICAAVATPSQYGSSLTVHFPNREDKTAGEQAAFQAAALVSSIVIAIVGGIVTGFFLCIPAFDRLRDERIFDDSPYWILPETKEVLHHEKNENPETVCLQMRLSETKEKQSSD